MTSTHRSGDPASRCPADVQSFRRLSRCQPSFPEGLRGCNGLLIQGWTAGPSAPFSGRRNSVPRTLGDEPPLEAGDGPENMEHQLADGDLTESGIAGPEERREQERLDRQRLAGREGGLARRLQPALYAEKREDT